MIAAAVLASSAIAGASPKTPKAKAAFTAGVKAYQKHDYALASKQLGKSFGLERDVETLFAWAQSERQLDHCDKASELYDKILTFDMPAANKEAVQAKLAECKQLLDAAKPAPDTRTSPLVVEPKRKPEPEPEPAPHQVEEPRSPPPPPPPESHAWWKNPVGLSLVGVGIVGGVVGTGYLVAGSSAHSQMTTFDKTDRTQYLHYQDVAKTDGQRGVVALALGGGLLAVGVIWFATHGGHHDETPTITGWISPSSGGLAVGGGF